MVGTNPMDRLSRRMNALHSAAAGASWMNRMVRLRWGARKGTVLLLKKAPNVYTFVVRNPLLIA